ncbi:MAG TPA: hypothetical protein VNJ29_01035, partial [Candidatus Nitrosotenuis sp.]|nr:hypothetical protein [Candidatus Nitrosotenuis sp.]
FKMLSSEGYFLPGTPLKNLTIIQDESVISRVSGEVIYAIASNEEQERCYRIGVQFNKDQKRRSVLGKRPLPHQVRPLRYGDDTIENLSKIVVFTFKNKQEVSHKILNFSKYGVAFQLSENENLFRLGDVLESLQIVVNNEMVYCGKATIVNLREDGKELVIGVALRGTLLDIERIFSIKRTEETSRELIQHIKTSCISDKADSTFKTQVADIRYFLEKIKKVLDAEEESLKSEVSGIRKSIEKKLISDVAKEAFEYLDRSFENLNGIVKNFNSEQHNIHKEYFQSHLHPLFLLSPFVLRCFTKPLGYAGDYEMMDMIYRDPDEGNTLFSRLLNIYSCYHIRPARASRNRIPYLLKQISNVVNKVIEKDGNAKAKISSIACGPANEITDFIKNSEKSNQCEINLIDIEPEALYTSQDRLLALKALNRHDVKITFQNKSIKQIIQESKKNSAQHKQHIIYSAGLFEYLSHETAARLVEVLYETLDFGGTLIIGNFDPSNEFKCFMDYVAEWYLIYRTKEEMLSLANGIPQYRNIWCESEETGINNFLVIEK